MADEMMRISGRGDDGTAKAIKTDNNGSLSTYGRISSEVILQDIGDVVGTGVTLDVEGYSSVVFEVITSIDFDGEILFLGKSKNSSGGSISLKNVLKESPSMFLVHGKISTSTLADVSGSYSVNISGMKEVHARIDKIISGTVTIKAKAYSMPNLLIQNLLLANQVTEIKAEISTISTFLSTRARNVELARVANIPLEPYISGTTPAVISNIDTKCYPINHCMVRADSWHHFQVEFYYKIKSGGGIDQAMIPAITVIDVNELRSKSGWIEADSGLIDVKIINLDDQPHTYNVVLYGVG